jgi:urease beta subunit
MPTMTKRAPTKARKTPQNKSASNKHASLAAAIKTELSKSIVPGEIFVAPGDIEAFKGRATRELKVKNTADRPIQVGSHCHFFEANHALAFDREQAFGFRLCIPAGAAVRFEPGEEKRVTVVALAGKRLAHGINGLTNGSLDNGQVKSQALARAKERGFVEKP